ncbi:DNA alkylation repair protein [Candidatus Parcubacteria bacterium]|nr:MAG: DNA alkylation repair protein [Candidatus Parcubacteria bacterium]
MKKINELKKELEELSNKKQKEISQKFFKTGKGEYAEGDIFLGIKVPVMRALARGFYDLSLNDLQTLLKSKIHEHRFIALVILSEKFKIADLEYQEAIYRLYLENTKNINNWDLVDISAPNIVGAYLKDKDRRVLYTLAGSKNLWERRIAIVSTFTFIRNNDFFETITISELLINDPHDLIHKASGWMLREMGKKDEKTLKKFLNKFKEKMPRTMLRYAIEKFKPEERKKYLAK